MNTSPSVSATCFRNAKSYEQCKDCLMKAAECHKQNRSLFYAAKAIDQAILMCKETGNLAEIPQLANRACEFYQTHGSADTAASSLDKAAKIIEHHSPEQAMVLFQHAADITLVNSPIGIVFAHHICYNFRYRRIIGKLLNISIEYLEFM